MEEDTPTLWKDWKIGKLEEQNLEKVSFGWSEI